MDKEIKTILLRIVVGLKQAGWHVKPDWELSFRAEGNVPLSKYVSVTANLEEEWTEEIETIIELSLKSDDQITYFATYTIYANMHVEGGSMHDMVEKLDADVAFTKNDVRDTRKTNECVSKINRIVDDSVEAEFTNYVERNAEEILSYKHGGWEADDDARDDR